MDPSTPRSTRANDTSLRNAVGERRWKMREGTREGSSNEAIDKGRKLGAGGEGASERE